MIEEQDDFALEHGTGNVFVDLGLPDAEREQLRAVLAAEIGKSLVDDSLSVRDAERLTGFAAADFSRIRRAKLKGFTIDRLMTILEKCLEDLSFEASERHGQKIVVDGKLV
jgi:predicted XRE-type DNA-binding protein